ncbi:MAG: hypothetical protein H7Z14_19530 [Anaerolineae bacterium]|nr:hypothetical protein [Phycisphaerae bacterium]
MAPSRPTLLLAGAALAFYIASRLGAAVLDRRGNNPAGAAAAHWLPMAAVTLTVLKQYPHAAVSIIFASSVACLTLVPGVTLLTAQPPAPGEPLPVEPLDVNDRRARSMVLPAALLTLLAGFRGFFTLFHALLFILQGVAVLFAWTSAPDESASVRVGGGNRFSPILAVLQIGSWILLTLAGAYIATSGIQDISSRVPHLTTGVIGVLMIAPALVLPMIGSALSMTQRGRGGAVISTSVDCVLLNLCVLLPITIIAWQVMSNWTGFGSMMRGRLFDAPATPLPYPMAAWRIDAVMLIIFGAALLLVSTKRWVPGRAEGVIGVLAFALYMMANAKLATK